MISDIDKKTIQQIATKYHVKRVVLFGSSLYPDSESRDIDIGVEGVDEGDFFSFYGDLIFALSKPVDVIDLSVRSRFVDLIKREGIPLYA
jgi:predicted nucleotidyltransferase